MRVWRRSLSLSFSWLFLSKCRRMSVARFYHDDNEPSIFCLHTSAEAIYQVNLYETDISLRWADESAERFTMMKFIVFLQRYAW